MSQNISFQDKTVLLVEDELFLAEKIGRQLAALGVKEVIAATTLEDAQRQLETETVDMALLDVNLPDNQTTLDLGASLSSDGVPVVFFSGFSVDEMSDVANGIEFLEKPISLPRLKAALHRAILRAATRALTEDDNPAMEEKMRRSG